MGVITRDEVREILEEIIKDQSQINTAENTDENERKKFDKGINVLNKGE